MSAQTNGVNGTSGVHKAHENSVLPILSGVADAEPRSPSAALSSLSLSSQAIHADDFLNTAQDVAPSMHVSTTFRYSNDPDKLMHITERTEAQIPFEGDIYSRETTPNTNRFEAILSSLLKGPAVSYASGLSAFHAMLVFLNPKAIAIRDGYHGCHGVIGIHQKLSGLKKLDLGCPAEELQAGDIVHVETPLNPTGLATNLKAYAEKAHARGAYLTVDATFAPPPLQDPFLWGADIVMHSGTKYIGGHSDMLCGVLVFNPAKIQPGWIEKIKTERTYLGNVMGSMEGWLGVRSLRTLEIRVQRQSYNVGMLVGWLNSALHPAKDSAVDQATRKAVQTVVESIQHASLQESDVKEGWLKKQMPNGFGPVFAITMKTQDMAKRLPGRLSLLYHATSLGGVESLIEWRCMTDPTVDTRLLRVSIGIEGWEDLRDDFIQAFKALADG